MRSTWALMRPTGAPVAPGEEVLGLGVLEERVPLTVQELASLEHERRHPVRLVTIEPPGQLDEGREVALGGDRPDVETHWRRTLYAHHHRRLQPRPARTSASRSSRRARELDALPYFRLLESAAGPVVEMEGARRIMLGSNNYLGLTGDERVIQGALDALHRYGTGADRLAAAQRHARPPPRAGAGARRLARHRGRARLHDRPPGQPRRARHDPRPGRHGDRRLRRPRLDPRRRAALAREAARLPPQPARPAREAPAAGGGRRRRDPRRRRRRLLDGGRRRAAAGDRRPLRPLRRAADGRRGARARRARRARRRARASCSASRTGSTCGWGRSRSRSPPAAA